MTLRALIDAVVRVGGDADVNTNRGGREGRASAAAAGRVLVVVHSGKSATVFFLSGTEKSPPADPALDSGRSPHNLNLWPGRAPALSRRVIVNLKDDHDHAIDGVLVRWSGSWLIVRQARLVRSGGAAGAAMDGEIMIDRSNVAFIQVLP